METKDTWNYKIALQAEFTTRKARNPSYSLRSYARDLGVGVATLSDVFNGKRELSRRNALRVAEQLGWSPVETAYLKSHILAAAPLADLAALQLQEDEFRLIADWYFLATLNLAKIPNNKADAAWVAERLGISTDQAFQALDGLQRLGYLKVKDNQLVRVVDRLRTTTDIASAAIRKYHKQNFLLAEQALDFVDVSEREVTSIIVATEKAKLLEAKKRITLFKRRLLKFLESDCPDSIYNLSLQLFPAKAHKENKL